MRKSQKTTVACHFQCSGKDEYNQTITSPEESTYGVYCFLTAASTVAHLTAFLFACSLMYTCAKICCVPVCGCIYRCLVSAGHTWYIFIAIGGFCNLAGSVALPIVVPAEDVINIYGYQLALGSLGFDIIT
ncbi:uncharacterized protein LOC128548296 isoform X2 [Mercenaria mercenaria]|nr:uncharacterized protein LOC128548296 isoform X2 [Mercenaria mercenaria]